MEAERIYTIAGFTVRITGGATLRALDRVPGFEPFAAEVGGVRDTPDMELQMDGDLTPATLRGMSRLHTFTTGGLVGDLRSTPEGWLFDMRKESGPEGEPLVRVACSPEAGVATVYGEAEGEVLKFATWVAFSFFAVHHATIPVHASAVVRNGSAVLFLGESGTGKSTHTGLWMRHLDNAWLLNDDSPLVRIRPDGIFAYGSPWSGKTHCYQAEIVPLRAMVRLRQGRRNRIGPLAGSRTIGALWPSCPPLLAADGGLSALMLEVVGRITSTVPVYEMECRPDRKAALVACDAIYGTI